MSLLRLAAQKFRLQLISLALGIVGCSDNTTVLTPVFATPAALAIGDHNNRVFVLNQGEETLNILNLQKGLGDMRFEKSDAYFPLRITVGQAPMAMVSIAEGRYLAVLSAFDGALRLVDTTTLQLLSAGDVPLTLEGATTLIVNPLSGLIYVAEKVADKSGFVVEVEFQAEPTPHLVKRRLYTVGGLPQALVSISHGQALLILDGAASHLTRLDLNTGSTETYDTGAVGNTLAVSTDERYALVSRPSFLDIAVFDLERPWTPMDVDAAFNRSPQCLQRCAFGGVSDEEVCTVLHPADAELCKTDTQINFLPPHYSGLYVGGVVTKIATQGIGAGDPALTVSCDATTRGYSEYAILALADGTLRAVGLKDDEQHTPELISATFCKPSELKWNSSDVRATDLLTPCPLPAGERRRLACLENAGAGINAWLGFGGVSHWEFDWEGVLSGFSRPHGGGMLLDETHLWDSALEFDATAIHSGDILEILSPPLKDPACITAIGESGACALERRIVLVENSGGKSSLVVDRPLPKACFLPGASIAYQLRAGDEFIVSHAAQTFRLKPGATFGVSEGVASAAVFALQPIDTRQTLASCERYADLPLSSPLHRDRRLTLDLSDASTPAIFGYDVQSEQLVYGTAAGRLPGDILAIHGESPLLFVSYSGSNSLLAIANLQLPSPSSKIANYRVVR